MNDKLRGIRGILTILGTWAMIGVDTFTANITGISKDSLKAAFIASLPITCKLIWTDLRPKILKFMETP